MSNVLCLYKKRPTDGILLGNGSIFPQIIIILREYVFKFAFIVGAIRKLQITNIVYTIQFGVAATYLSSTWKNVITLLDS